MKTILRFLASLAILVMLTGQATAGLIYLRNNLGYSVPVLVVQNKQQLLNTWLRRDEVAVVRVDENNPKKPVLYLRVKANPVSSRETVKAYILPRKVRTLGYNLSQFTSGR